MCKGRRDVDIPTGQKDTLEIKNIEAEMKTAVDGLLSKLGVAEERRSELEEISIELSRTEKQRERSLEKNKNPEHPRTVR